MKSMPLILWQALVMARYNCFSWFAKLRQIAIVSHTLSILQPKLLDEKQTTVYKKDADVNYQLKMKASRFIFSEIKENFPHMPFTARCLFYLLKHLIHIMSAANVTWEYRSLEEKRARLGLVECVNHGHLLPYPVLYEKPGKDYESFSLF